MAYAPGTFRWERGDCRRLWLPRKSKKRKNDQSSCCAGLQTDDGCETLAAWAEGQPSAVPWTNTDQEDIHRSFLRQDAERQAAWKTFFSNEWNRLPQYVTDSSSVNVFKNCLRETREEKLASPSNTSTSTSNSSAAWATLVKSEHPVQVLHRP